MAKKKKESKAKKVRLLPTELDSFIAWLNTKNVEFIGPPEKQPYEQLRWRDGRHKCVLFKSFAGSLEAHIAVLQYRSTHPNPTGVDFSDPIYAWELPKNYKGEKSDQASRAWIERMLGKPKPVEDKKGWEPSLLERLSTEPEPISPANTSIINVLILPNEMEEFFDWLRSQNCKVETPTNPDSSVFFVLSLHPTIKSVALRRITQATL